MVYYFLNWEKWFLVDDFDGDLDENDQTNFFKEYCLIFLCQLNCKLKDTAQSFHHDQKLIFVKKNTKDYPLLLLFWAKISIWTVFPELKYISIKYSLLHSSEKDDYVSLNKLILSIPFMQTFAVER